MNITFKTLAFIAVGAGACCFGSIIGHMAGLTVGAEAATMGAFEIIGGAACFGGFLQEVFS